MADLNYYLARVTSEHAKRPKYLAVLSLFLQGQVDLQNTAEAALLLFDLDTATGHRLDWIGQWIGQSRYLTTPLVGVYFSLDTLSLGFDEGSWKGPFDPDTGLTALGDDAYRTLLRARILSNYWDGSIPKAYEFLQKVFPRHVAFIQDNQDMTMYIGVIGPTPLDAVTYALLTGGYLATKPSGVRIRGYVTPSVSDTPVFGFDVQNSTIAGFDTGSFATVTGGS